MGQVSVVKMGVFLRMLGVYQLISFLKKKKPKSVNKAPCNTYARSVPFDATLAKGVYGTFSQENSGVSCAVSWCTGATNARAISAVSYGSVLKTSNEDSFLSPLNPTSPVNVWDTVDSSTNDSSTSDRYSEYRSWGLD